MARLSVTKRLSNLLGRRVSHLRSVGRMVLLAGAVGVMAGVGAVVFQWLCHVVTHYAMDMAAGYREMSPAGETLMDQIFKPTGSPLRPWVLVVMPALGGIVTGLLVRYVEPLVAGPGAGVAIGAYHNRDGVISGRVGVIKIIASAITLGTGGSGGREGPIALVGASCGSYLSEKFNLSPRERRTLLVAGMGAGIGAFFRAPLAGAIFAIEVLYADPEFEADSLIPAFFATTTAYCVFSLAFGVEPVFRMRELSQFKNPVLLGPLTALTCVMVMLSLLFARCLGGVQKFFERSAVPIWLRPAAGALGTGVVGVAIFYCLTPMADNLRMHSLSVLGYGHGFLQRLLSGELPRSGAVVVLLVVVALGKMLTTSLTIGSGGSGGLFGPSLVIGGAFGALVGMLFNWWMPSIVPRVDVFMILGAAGFFTAAANTPVSTLIMVSEMTGSYAMFVPSMWVCALAYLLSRGWSVYREQVNGRVDSPAHRGELIVDVLTGMTVADVWKGPSSELVTIPAKTPLNEAAVAVAGTKQVCFPVTGADGLMCGYFSLEDIRYYLYDNQAGEFATAEQIAAVDVEPLTPQTSLTRAMARFARTDYAELPIASPDAPGLITGLLRRQEVIAAYNAKLSERAK